MKNKKIRNNEINSIKSKHIPTQTTEEFLVWIFLFGIEKLC
jgi:hypothetical protein